MGLAGHLVSWPHCYLIAMGGPLLPSRLKAAHQPYAPNARSHSLKLKVEFIPGLGDSVTLLLLGARTPRRLGGGARSGTPRIAAFVVALHALASLTPLARPCRDTAHR